MSERQRTTDDAPPSAAKSWRAVTGVLLLGAAAGAVVLSSNATAPGRVAGVLAAVMMVGVGIGVWRGQGWAAGGAFLFGLCWFWAVIALFVQSAIGAGELLFWLVWSIVVMVASVQGRPVRTPPDPLPSPEDET